MVQISVNKNYGTFNKTLKDGTVYEYGVIGPETICYGKAASGAYESCLDYEEAPAVPPARPGEPLTGAGLLALFGKVNMKAPTKEELRGWRVGTCFVAEPRSSLLVGVDAGTGIKFVYLSSTTSRFFDSLDDAKRAEIKAFVQEASAEGNAETAVFGAGEVTERLGIYALRVSNFDGRLVLQAKVAEGPNAGEVSHACYFEKARVD